MKEKVNLAALGGNLQSKKTEKKEKTGLKASYKLYFRCEEGFGMSKDEQGKVGLPFYMLMPFSEQDPTKSKKEEEL